MQMEGRWSKRTRPEQWGRKGFEWERWGAGTQGGSEWGGELEKQGGCLTRPLRPGNAGQKRALCRGLQGPEVPGEGAAGAGLREGLQAGLRWTLGRHARATWCWEWASWSVCCLLLLPGHGPAGRPAWCLTPAGAFTGLRWGPLCGSVVPTRDGADICPGLTPRTTMAAHRESSPPTGLSSQPDGLGMGWEAGQGKEDMGRNGELLKHAGWGAPGPMDCGAYSHPPTPEGLPCGPRLRALTPPPAQGLSIAVQDRGSSLAGVWSSAPRHAGRRQPRVPNT